jgi:hypothetical protein
MTSQDLIDYYVKGYRFEKITGIGKTNFYNWVNQGYIPEGAQYKIQHLTEGKLKAGPPYGPKDKI